MSTFDWTGDRGDPQTNNTDQVRIELRFIEDLLENEPIEDWVISSLGSAWDEDWLITEVESIIHDGYQDENGNWILGGPLYDAKFVRRRINWGADASFFLILIDLGVGLIGAATWDSIKLLGGRMAKRLKSTRPGAHHPLTEQEAVERVTWLLEERYNKERDSFRLISVDSAGDGISIVVADNDDVRYLCTLIVVDGLIDIVRIRREFGHQA